VSKPVLNAIEVQAETLPPGGMFQAVPTSGRDDKQLVIGIDLGGTKLLGAIANADGSVLAERELATGSDGPVAQVSGLVNALVAVAGVDRSRLAQVVVGVPGVVDAEGAVSLSPHVVFDRGVPFADAVGTVLGVPVFADNDANIAAFGEYSVRTDQRQSGVVLLTLGTGVGMGIVVNGEILRGAHGAAGEIGSMPYSVSVPEQPPRHYEGPVSTSGILAAYQAAGGQLNTVREIFDAADAGDSVARAAVDQCLRDLANGLGIVVSLLDPGLIVLGGGIGARPGVAGRVAVELAALVPTPCAVVASRLGTRAGLVGALAKAERLVATRLAAAVKEATS
jgi:glucokinase